MNLHNVRLGYERLQLTTNEKYPALQYASYIYLASHCTAKLSPSSAKKQPSLLHCSSTSFSKHSPISHPILTLLTSNSTHSHIYISSSSRLPYLIYMYIHVPTHHFEGCYRREPGGSGRGQWVQTTESAAPESVLPYHWCGLLSGVIKAELYTTIYKYKTWMYAYSCMYRSFQVGFQLQLRFNL